MYNQQQQPGGYGGGYPGDPANNAPQQDPASAMMAMNSYMMNPAAWASMMASYYGAYGGNYSNYGGAAAQQPSSAYSMYPPGMGMSMGGSAMMNFQQPNGPPTEPQAPLPEDTPAPPPQ